MAKKRPSAKKPVARTKAVKATRPKPPRRVSGARSLPAQQGQKPKRADVGPGRPPVEHQFAPGQSGNPAGTPASRANLWRYICGFLALGEAEACRCQMDKTRPLAMRIAAKQALQLLKKGLGGVALHATMRMWDRDEGRPVAHVVMESPDVLTPEECDEIREAMRTGGK